MGLHYINVVEIFNKIILKLVVLYCTTYNHVGYIENKLVAVGYRELTRVQELFEMDLP